MLLLGKSPNDCSMEDINRLVTEQIPENRSLEYKESTYPRDKRDDFLADVTAFANTTGGFILIGIACDKGLPIGAPGVPAEAVDAAWLQMLNWMRDGLDPRIDGVIRVDVSIDNGRKVLVIGIPRSWNLPHMVRGNSRFYVRTNAGNEPCDCGQIRSLVSQSGDVQRKVREWRAERIATLLSGLGPEPLGAIDGANGAEPIVAIHMVPLVSLAGETVVDFISSRPARLNPLAWTGGNHDRYCFDGMLWDSIELVRSGQRTCVGYTLLFRDGKIETASVRVVLPADPASIGYRPLYGYRVEDCVLTFLRNAFPFCRLVGVDAPMVIMVSILGVKNYALVHSPHEVRSTLRPIGRDVLVLPEIVVRDLSDSPEVVMRSAFDAMWNASGWSASPYYNQQGEWIRLR
ncbi:MAG: ATP-binding protein [Elusimicrobia bacterium]|nr:ATP-binding protein [Elusimicrobiota bacterium]